MLGPDDFLGEWSLSRQISDRLGQANGEFIGVAAFAHAENGLTYQETGVLRLANGTEMRADRRYFWRFSEGAVSVAFDDGRAFHSFQPTGQSDGTAHLCGEDLYQCAYDFSAWPLWNAVWTVTGPRKDYTSQTTYQRTG